MGFFVFATIFLLVMALMNVYLWRRFLRKLGHSPRRALIVVPVLLMLGNIFFIIDAATDIVPDSPRLYMISSAFIGVTFMLFVIAVAYDLTLSVSRRVPLDHSRRRFIKLVFDVTVLIMAVAWLLRGLAQGIRRPPVQRVAVRVRDFPHDEFSIVQLSDIHVGRTIRRDFIEYLVVQTNALKPDLVVITGDLVDLPVARIEYDLHPLKDLQAPSFFILGNHEYFHGPGEALAFVRELGITPLLNESVIIGKGGSRFNLVGLNDLAGARSGLFPPDVAAAWAEVDETLPCIVLAHQPRMINELGDRRCDLMLSGHTHGGQIFPFGLMVMAAQPYLAGLHTHTSDRQIYVSRGAGYWGPPLRVLAPNEISHIVISGMA